MAYLHPVAAVPNSLIADKALSYSAKRVALVLLLLSGRKNRSVTVSFAVLAKQAQCSTTTAQKAVRELCALGYLQKKHRFSQREKWNHLIYAANSYLWLYREGGYTLISRDVLAYPLKPAAFAVLLYLYQCAGRKGRAFPSLRRIANKGLQMAKSTVCLAIKALKRLQAIVCHRCFTKRRCYASSSYYLTNFVFSRKSNLPYGGSPKSDKPNSINQITENMGAEEYIKSLQAKGCRWYDHWFSSVYYFDGTGVRVGAWEDEEVTA